MRIGILAEGPSDVAVITNIIKGVTGLETNDIIAIQPKLQFDNTHLAHLDPDSHSTWSLVKNECIEQKKINSFFKLADSKYFAIHLDTAEAELYGVERPKTNDENYCSLLRETVINKINEWLDGKYQKEVLYAIAIQETDAWILTLHEKSESCLISDPKKELKKKFQKLKYKYEAGYKPYLIFSDDFKYSSKIRRLKCREYNCSLNDFYIQLEALIK